MNESKRKVRHLGAKIFVVIISLTLIGIICLCLQGTRSGIAAHKQQLYDELINAVTEQIKMEQRPKFYTTRVLDDPASYDDSINNCIKKLGRFEVYKDVGEISRYVDTKRLFNEEKYKEAYERMGTAQFDILNVYIKANATALRQKVFVAKANRFNYPVYKEKSKIEYEEWIPYVGMSEKYIDGTKLGKHTNSRTEMHSPGFDYNKDELFCTAYSFSNSDYSYVVWCSDGKVVDVIRYDLNKKSPKTKVKNTHKSSDELNNPKYYFTDAEDMYDELYDDFYDYEEAEDYWNEK